MAFVRFACAAGGTQPPTIYFEQDGSARDRIPALKPGESFYFEVPKGLSLIYEFSDEVRDGKVLSCSKPTTADPAKPIRVPNDIQVTRTMADQTERKETRPVRALYFNLMGKPAGADDDRAKLTELQSKLRYYSGLDHPLSWAEKNAIQEQISNRNDEISQLQEEIKAYTGMSLTAAVTAIDERQRAIRRLRAEVKALQKSLDNAGLKEQIASLNAAIAELSATIENAGKLVRAGVVIIGENRKSVYYALRRSGDASAPWLLKRFQDFPVFTTEDVPYVVVLGERRGDDLQGLRATFTSKAGAYIDAEPVRPLLTQPTAQSGSEKTIEKLLPPPGVCGVPDPPTYAYVDHVLQFTDRLAGETVYTVTVSGYGAATTTDTVTVAKGTSASEQHQTVVSRTTLKPLDGDAWPQVHSKYRYNLAAGMLWSTLRAPSFSRVATGNYLPAGCDPTTSVSISAGGSAGNGSSTSVGTTITCTPTYETLTVSGGPRVLPALMFSYYWRKRDTQTKRGSWWWALPVPTAGVSLTSPADDFFLGGSSEFKFLRNVQLVYGWHLGRIPKLGSNSFQNPTDSSAPQTTTTLQPGKFVGLTFNLDFIKGIFKP